MPTLAIIMSHDIFCKGKNSKNLSAFLTVSPTLTSQDDTICCACRIWDTLHLWDIMDSSNEI